MRRTPVATALVALVILVVLAMITGSTASTSSAPKPGSAPVNSATLVCPLLNGQPAGTASRASVADVAAALTPASHSSGVVAATVTGKRSKSRVLHPAPAAVLHSVSGASQQIEVSAAGSVSATLAGDVMIEDATGRSRGLAVGRCAAPATDWWFTGAEGRVGFTDLLVISNAAPTPALVEVGLWGDKGSEPNSQLQSLSIPPRSSVRVPVSSAAPDISSVAIHVHAESGAVAAAVLDHRSAGLLSNGGDFIPATNPPSTSAVVSGFAAGNGARYLIVTAPGDVDATVNLRLVTRSGSFAPSGINQVVVRAAHSRAIDLTAALGQSSGAVTLVSDQPVLANGISVIPSRGQRPDLMWTAATPPLTHPAAIANGRQPDGGPTWLYLTAPGAAAQVRVTGSTGHTRTISIPAGKSVAADITATIRSSAVSWPFTVTPIGSAPVYGVDALRFSGAHGALIASEPLVGLPTPIALPPVREDPAAAVR